MQLNRLAEDIRILEEVPGLVALISDLKIVKRFEPTLHEIHTAALFHRGAQAVLKFYPHSNDSVPDFDTNIQQRTPVEVKQLMPSAMSSRFSGLSFELHQQLIKDLDIANLSAEAEIVIAVKKYGDMPHPAELVGLIPEILSELLRGRMYASPVFNLFAKPLPPSEGFHERINIQVISPADPKEDERVEGLLKKANRQLRLNTQEAAPGIVCIGLSEMQDAEAVVNLMQRKFSDGQFRSISAVLLHRNARFGDSRSDKMADALSFVSNENANVPIVSTVQLSGPELIGKIEELPLGDTISCYNTCWSQGRIKDKNLPGWIGVNPMRRADPKMFA
ncbi:hypothetical protein ACU5AX_09190 [Sphingomonas sp. XXL09]|uniref:hypothetical protein n=1 Tax=Sphingomonas sp. XXL09 TaxID=3457787 RepID=UPI00406BCD9E